MKVVEIRFEDALYKCYPTRPSAERTQYIVAGIGSITLARDTGTVLEVAPVMRHGALTLTKLAPLLQEAAPLVDKRVA